jgi:type VI secretion system secreted protein Hcp
MKTWIRTFVTGAMLTACLAATQVADAAIAMVASIGKIRGESVVTNHTDAIDVLSWSWGVTQPTTKVGAVVASKPVINAITLTKYVDASSPLLFQQAVQGTVIPEAEFVVIKIGSKGLVDLIRIKLTGVMVSSMSTGKQTATDRFTEEVSLVFSAAEYTYYSMKPDGTQGPGVTMRWSASK